MPEQKKIILGVSASIALYKACDLLRRLKGEGFSVTVVMTKEARELIRPVVFQSLSGNKVYCDMFASSRACKLENNGLASDNQSHWPAGRGLASDNQSHWPAGRGLASDNQSQQIEHISLAEKAILTLIAPATANIIGKIACGICDDLLTCVVCATKAPVLIAPAMNENMYLNKITQSNIKKLKEIGYKFIEPRKGELACGREGVGCLADIETIVKKVKLAT